MKELIEKYAVSQFKRFEFLHEWKIEMIILMVAKIITLIVSAWSAYNYFYLVIAPIIQIQLASVFISIFILIVIEILTNTFISKFWKFALHGKIGLAVSLFVISVSVFSISFYTSCEGLALNRSQKIDETMSIKQKFATRQENNEKQANLNIDNLQKEIETIKNNPAGWVGGRREILLPEQLQTIEKYQTEIAKLRDINERKRIENESNESNELMNNERKTNNEASKYYSIVAIIMIIQMIVNGALMFFWSRIYFDKEKENIYLEQFASIGETTDFIKKKLIQTYLNEAITVQNYVLQHITDKKNESNNERMNEYTLKVSTLLDEKKTNETEIMNEPITNEIIKTNEPNEPETVKLIETNNVKKKRIIGEVYNCEFCGKQYILNHVAKRFCSPKCKIDAWNQNNEGKLKLKIV